LVLKVNRVELQRNGNDQKDRFGCF